MWVCEGSLCPRKAARCKRAQPCRGGTLQASLEAGEALETALEAVHTLEAVEALETSAKELWTSLEAAEELEMVGMQQCL